MLMRRPCFFAEEEWKTVPWALDPESKSQQNHLTDILVDVPGLLAEDEARKEHDSLAIRVHLRERVQRTLFALYCWRYKWELANPDAVWETTPVPSIAKSRVIQPYLNFKIHEQAAEIQLYNVILLFLLGLFSGLAGPEVPPFDLLYETAVVAAKASNYPISTPGPGTSTLVQGTTTPLDLPHDDITCRTAAVEIIRAFEFQMTDLNSTTSSLYFIFPLGTAYEVLKEDPEYRAWMRTLLDAAPVTNKYVAAGRNRHVISNFHFCPFVHCLLALESYADYIS
jgi:hypothetical protein